MRGTFIQALALAGILAFAAGAAEAAGPTLVQVDGRVEVGTGQPPVWTVAEAGTELAPGQSIRVGSDARAELDLGAKGTVRLYENTLLRLPPEAFAADGATAVELEEGGSLFDIDKSRNGSGFEVRTPEAVVMVKGTRFSVALRGSEAAVSVFRGLVGVTGLADSFEHEVLVRQGFTAVGGTRPFELRLEQRGDPWQSWGTDQKLELPVPDEATELVPASIDVAKARAAALTEARRSMARQFLRRNPEVRRQMAERIAEARAEGMDDADDGNFDDDFDPDQMRADLGDSSGPGSYGDGSGHSGPGSGVTDPIGQMPDDDMQNEIEDAIAEQLLNGGSGSAGCTIGCLSIVYNDSSGPGPESVKFFVDGGFIGEMTESDVDQVIQTGTTTGIPAPVMAALIGNQLNPIQYMMLVDDIYF